MNGVKALAWSARLWFAVALAGQAAFALYVIAFYGRAAAAGNYAKWNEVLVGGFIPGGLIGNLILGAHLLLAVTITLGGPLQLIPAIRARVPAFHRWNGRIYLLTALVMSVGGAFMVWTRGTAGGDAMRIGITINGVLIVAAAWIAWRHARGKRFAEHRRWALRAFLLVNGVWCFRVGLMLWILVNQGPVGIGSDFDGPFVRVWAFGCYLLPLAILELYLRPRAGWGTALLLFLVTLAMGVGIVGAVMGMWLPRFGG
ncbi:MAG: DUF2306 domain-containing protein [Sphingomonas sp.]|uniref:DUF2306 domain-containing protein n=1 Tax=Sphingomonas sp. TaxID=28214 RepID=UPI0025DA5F4C|nr:DUF2306 domain-containing protein [Sphingomonas sp.]MBX3563849.1 DUF2306 domain-containing protein [Sphingomonas sp.]